MLNFALNGSFLLERATGLQRYALELICALDKLEIKNIKIKLVVPKNALNMPELQNIKIVKYGSIIHGFKKAILWEQTCFAFYCITQKNIPVSLCNVTPLLKPCGISTIHDLSYKVNSHFFNNLYGYLSKFWHRINYWFIFKFSKKIITVSEFSKAEILKYSNVKTENIFVVSNGWQHILKGSPAATSACQDYFFAMSNVTRIKNFKWILEVAKRSSNLKFKIAGSFNPKKLSDNFDFSKFPNVEFLGYVSDEQAKNLIKNAKAFLFPSFYEGFGIPPMESLALGTPAIVSDIPVMHEIYENSVHYIDPYNYDVDLEKILQESVESSNRILEKYDWKKSAKMFRKLLEDKAA